MRRCVVRGCQGWATAETRSLALHFTIDLVYSGALPRDMREQVLDALWLAISRQTDDGAMPGFRTREFDDLVRGCVPRPTA